VTVLAATAVGGFTDGFDLVPVALRRVRERMLDVCDDLSADEWTAPSRCERWNVHDVVRHVRDASHIHVASLRGEPTPFSQGGPFDTQETPRRWLEQSAGQSPDDTLGELRECCATEELTLEARRAGGAGDVVGGPYGEIHWAVLTTHVFWDAWLHARDVTEALRRESRSTPEEDRVVALYSLLIASMPAVRVDYPFDLTVALVGADRTRYVASVTPGRVDVRTAAVADDADLEGVLGPVADALAGRGPELESVLHGERALLEPLTWLRARLRPGSDRGAQPG
jgi:hypothetical protein